MKYAPHTYVSWQHKCHYCMLKREIYALRTYQAHWLSPFFSLVKYPPRTYVRQHAHNVQHVQHTASENIFPVGRRTLAYLAHGILKTAPNPIKQKICTLCVIQLRGFSWLPQTHVHRHTQLKYLTFPTNITSLLLIFSACT